MALLLLKLRVTNESGFSLFRWKERSTKVQGDLSIRLLVVFELLLLVLLLLVVMVLAVVVVVVLLLLLVMVVR